MCAPIPHSSIIPRQVAELLIKATTERPKEIKDRAAQRLAQEEAGIEGAPRTGGEFFFCSPEL